MYSYETIVKMYCTTSCWIVHAIASKSESVKYYFKHQWKLFWYVFQKKKLTTYLRIMSGARVSLQKISKAEKFLLRAINRVKCYNILRPRSRRFLLALTSKFHVDNKLCVGSTQENTFTVSVTFKTFGEKKKS